MTDINGPTSWYWEILANERLTDIRRLKSAQDCRGWVRDWYWLRGLLTQEEDHALHRLDILRAVLGGMKK